MAASRRATTPGRSSSPLPAAARWGYLASVRRVIIVGAGPAGCSTALALCGTAGVQVLLLERRTLPRPKTCAGGLSPWTLGQLRRMGLLAPVLAEAHPIRWATIWTGRGQPLTLRGPFQAAVLVRERFDAILVDAARRAGAELRDGVAVTGLARDNGRVVGVRTSREVLEADAVVMATGAAARDGRAAPRDNRFFGILTRYEGIAGLADGLEMYLDDEQVHPHYAWVFPEGGGRANVGLCFRRGPAGPNARVLLERFVDRHLAPRLRGARQIGRVVAHPIRACWWPVPLASPGVLHVGEAAGLVDPWTGEGIYHALVSGRAAGAALAASGGLADRRACWRHAQQVRLRLVPVLTLGQSMVQAARTPGWRLLLRLAALEPVRRATERIYTSLPRALGALVQ